MTKIVSEKRIASLLVLLFLAAGAFAQRVSVEQARTKASRFLSERRNYLAGKDLRMAHRQALKSRQDVADDGAAYYVFNVGERAGFVVVSGDERTPAILGYAEGTAFNADSLPYNLQQWLAEYERQLEFIAQNDVANNVRPPLADDALPIIPAMLKSTWGQDAPYNNQCPIDPTYNQRSYTGCAATSLAQVMNYHRYPETTKASIPSYRTATRKIQMNTQPVTNIDWDNILNNYRYGYTTIQGNAVAKLMLLCGQAIRMDYTCEGSGAYSQYYASALVDYFGYDKSARLLSRGDYNAREWEQTVYDDLAQGRPVIYNGQSVGGGHSFVIDGYDGNGYFHVNWGWDGSNNNYFLLSVLNPDDNSGAGASSSSDGYSFYQDMVVGVMPDQGGQAYSLLLTVDNMKVSGAKTLTRGSNGSFKTSVTSVLYNMNGTAQNFDYGLTLQNKAGQVFQTLDQDNAGTIASYSGIYGNFTNVSFGSGLPDGIYRLVAVSGTTGTANMTSCSNSKSCYIEAAISGNTCVLREPSVSLSGTVRPTGSLSPNTQVPLLFTVKNDGLDFNDDVFLVVDGQVTEGRHLEVEANSYGEIEMAFVPTSVGTKHVALAYASDGYMKTVIEGDVNIARGAVAVNEYHLDYTVNIEKLRSDGSLSGNVLKGTVDVVNDGEIIYDNDIDIVLYQMGSDGTYNQIDTKTAPVKLELDEETTLDFTFSGLTYGQQYALTVWYCKDETDFTYNSVTVFVPKEASAEGEVYYLSPKITIDALTKEGTILGKTVTGSISVSNIGDLTYNDKVRVVLGKLNPETGNYGTYDSFVESVDIAAGASAEIPFTFKGLPHGGDYLIAFFYNEEPGKLVQHKTVKQFVTVAPEHLLSVAYQLANSERKGTRIRLNSSVAKVVATITNNGDYDYEDSVKVTLRLIEGTEHIDLGRAVMQYLVLDKGESKDIELSFDSLQNAKQYYISFDYVSNGEMTSTSSSSYVIVFTTHFTEEGISMARYFDGSNPGDMVVIRSVSGVTAARCRADEVEQRLAALPRGIYIVEGKVVRR